MDKSLILNSIKSHFGMKSDKELADFLGIKTTTLSMWKSRNTFDVELLFNKCENIDANYLLTGKGLMFRTDMLKPNNSHIYDPVDDEEVELRKKSNGPEINTGNVDFNAIFEDYRYMIKLLKEKVARLEVDLNDAHHDGRERSILYGNVAEPSQKLEKSKSK